MRKKKERKSCIATKDVIYRGVMNKVNLTLFNFLPLTLTAFNT